MNTTTTTWPGSDVVTPALGRPAAMRLAETEYHRVLDTVDALRPDDWSRPTDCTAWDVRQLVAHITGMAKCVSTPWEMARQVRAAKTRRHDGQQLIDAQNDLQVDERRDSAPTDLRAELRRVVPRAARARRLTPGFVRRLRLPDRQMFNGKPETWSIGYLIDVILTRDSWMHRLDLARATNGTPVLTAEHDGVIVADVVAEWARRHGQPYQLELNGPAGGRWVSGAGGEEIVMDAADFCRLVSGRIGSGGQPAGLLATQVPF